MLFCFVFQRCFSKRRGGGSSFLRTPSELTFQHKTGFGKDFRLPILQGCQTFETLLAGSSVGMLLVCLFL